MYSILNFIEETGQLIVKFDALPNPIAIDLPIENNRYLEGEPLIRYIEGFNPVWAVDRKKAIIEGIENIDYIRSLDTRSIDELRMDKARTIRAERDERLRASDWLMMSDAGFSDEAVTRFKKFRQELRDVPQQPGFPYDIIWPIAEGEWPNKK